MTWRELEDELVRRLSGAPSALDIPLKQPPGLAGFFWRLLRALGGDAEALAVAQKEVRDKGPVLRYLVEAVAHQAFPDRYPPPAPELEKAWSAYRRGRALFEALAEPFIEVLPPAAPLPLAAGPFEGRTTLIVDGRAHEVAVRFSGIEARPFEVILRVPDDLGDALQGSTARLYYRTPSGEAQASPEGVEFFPEEALLVLVFPEFWLYDPEGQPQDERVVTKVVLE